MGKKIGYSVEKKYVRVLGRERVQEWVGVGRQLVDDFNDPEYYNSSLVPASSSCSSSSPGSSSSSSSSSSVASFTSCNKKKIR